MAAAAILLAAGESRRMGSPKPLLAWESTTLVEYQVRQLRDAGADPVLVVVGERSGEVAPLAERAGGKVVENEQWRTGRASSLRAGAMALDEADAIVVLNVDQPRPAHVVRHLIEERESTAALIAAPVFQGQRGHPVVVEGSLLAELRSAQDETLGLRGIVGGHEDKVIEIIFESAVVVLDINTADDYEAAKVRYAELARE